jgi:glycosyltransferase involved in cell wall biosynthesis
MDATVIIPSYRSENTIERCLESLSSQETGFSYEIIVVDSSPDDYVNNVINKFPKVNFIKLKNKTYAGIARNTGAKEARGELLIFVDDDIIAPAHWLEGVIKYYRSGHDVFTGSIDLWNRKKAGILEKLEWFYEQSEFKPSMKNGEKWCLPSGTLAVKKELFREEKFTNMQRSQDIDFTVRLRKKGNSLHFNPRLKVFHIFQADPRQLLWKAFNSGLSNMQIRKMHNVPGSSFVRKAVLCFFAIPGFALVKLIRISWRNLKYNSLFDRLLYFLLFPAVVILIFSWIAGYYNALFAKSKAI